MKELFYKPSDGVTADFIPFYEDGVYHLFYLKDYRDPEKHGEGVPWFHVCTRDFIHFDELGEALPRGTKEQQDLCVFTGSVIRAAGCYHIFYTGHNPYFPANGKPMQAIMHASSNDLIRWEKIAEDTFYADPNKYEVDDFRDPFVYYDEEASIYTMLLVSRKKGCGITAGFTARYSSTDLKSWTDSGDFWAPNLFHTHECPDLFSMGQWQYMAYSEYSDRCLTRYIMARNKNGPWILPPDDSFDGRAFYAAKTAGDGKNHYLFGWIPTKDGENDRGDWQWGGNLAVHQLISRSDGTLGCKIPESIEGQFSIKEVLSGETVIANTEGRKDLKLFSSLDTYLFKASLKFSENTKLFGITLNQDFESKYGYKYEFVVNENMVRFDSVTSGINVLNVYRPIDLKQNSDISITLLAKDDLSTLYVNDQIALSARMYDRKGHDLSVFVVGGSIEIKHAVIFTLVN